LTGDDIQAVAKVHKKESDKPKSTKLQKRLTGYFL